MTNLQELETIYTTQNSFYKKAFYMIDDNMIKLFSYETLVAIIDTTNKTFKVANNENYFSRTTMRHVNEFKNQFFDNDNLSISDVRKMIENNETFK